MKRLIPCVVLLFIALQACKRESKDFSAISAIPKNAAIVIEMHKLHKAVSFLNESPLLQSGMTLPEVGSLQNLSSNVFEALNVNTKESSLKVYAYAQLAGADKYDWVICASTRGLKDFQGLNFNTEWALQKREYAQSQILILTRGEEKIYALNQNGLVAASLNENLIEEIIRNAENEISIAQNNMFKEHQKIATHSDPLTIFLNFEELPGMGKLLLQHSKPDWLQHFGTWAEIDISNENGNIILNGASINPDSSHTYINCFVHTGTAKISAPDIIPNNAAGAVMLGIEDFHRFHRQSDAYLKHWNLYRSVKKKRDALGVDLQTSFYPYIDEEFGVIYTEPKVNAAQSKMGYIKAKEAEKLMDILIDLSGEATENYREHLIFQLQRDKFLPATLGRAFKALNKPYFTQHDNWIVFANDPLVLRNAINAYIGEKTWSQSAGFQSIKSQFSASVNLWVLFKNQGAYNYSTLFMDDKTQRKAKKHKDVFSKPDWGGMQIINKGEASLIGGFIGMQADIAKDANQVWAIQLEAPIQSEPQFIYNHHTKQNDIVLQDSNNKLYWLNHKGEILWSAQIDGEILGKIEQVDLFKNNKFQLAFTTNKKFYILDRLGRNVAPFPITPPQEISAPLAVFDYDKSRNYRFIVCAGTQVFNYNKDGSIVKGWEFTKANDRISTKPKHYVLGGKDYVFFNDESGQFHVLNRRGETRVSLTNKMQVQDIYVQWGENLNNTRLVGTDNQDQLTYLFMNDKTDAVNVNMDEDLEHFTFDGKNMLLTAGSQLHNRHTDFPFTVDFESAIVHRPHLNTINDNPYFIATTEDDKIHLLGKDGEELPGFPVYGSTKASIGKFNKNGKIYLVGGTEDGTLYLYRISAN
ncbi:MAG: DUF3352 domain-containing protein [Schleiferiaceae bacterium]|nr:DUF3352 domain-containing protein [Schleiferiaceae bacterium]